MGCQLLIAEMITVNILSIKLLLFCNHAKENLWYMGATFAPIAALIAALMVALMVALIAETLMNKGIQAKCGSMGAKSL